MVQTATLLHAKAERLLGIGFDFRQSENSGVVAMATADDFVSDIVNVQQRRLTANFGDKSTDPLHSHQQALCGQFSQRAVNRHPAITKQRNQFAFRGNTVIRGPCPAVDLGFDHDLYPFIKGGGMFKYLIHGIRI